MSQKRTWDPRRMWLAGLAAVGLLLAAFSAQAIYDIYAVTGETDPRLVNIDSPYPPLSDYDGVPEPEPLPPPPPEAEELEPIEFPPELTALRVRGMLEIEVDWNCAGNAVHHEVWRALNGGGFEEIHSTECRGEGAVFRDVTVLPAARYCYEIRGSNYTDESISNRRCAITEQVSRVHTGSDLDPPAPVDRRAEIDMVTGRAAKIPMSWFWSRRGEDKLGGGPFAQRHNVSFRAVCTTGDALVGACDTAMVVSYRSCDGTGTCVHPQTLYNDDALPMQLDGFESGTGSRVTVPMQPYGVSGYEIAVFSQLRATSRTRVEYTLDGRTWQDLSGGWVDVGGTVVKLGALAEGDFLEVHTRKDQFSDYASQLLLFSPGSAREPIHAIQPRANDVDARLEIDDSNWETGSYYVVVGKRLRQTGRAQGVEVFADLVHGPETAPIAVSTDGCGGGSCSVQLSPGRYLFSAYARTDLPVGQYDGNSSTWHPSSEMPLENAIRCASESGGYDCRWETSCPNDANDGGGEELWYRGTPNGHALTLRVERELPNLVGFSVGSGFDFGSYAWQPVLERSIPRGAIGTDPALWSGSGSDPDGAWNRFVVPVEVSQPGNYRLSVVDRASDVEIGRDWEVLRNANATELKVASYNTLFTANEFNHNKYRNVAHLLGTRGEVEAVSGRVLESLDQAPFQWDVDVLALQEVTKRDSSRNLPDFGYSDVMQAELDRANAKRWRRAVGRGETWFTGRGTGPGMNPVFVNDLATPSQGVVFDSESMQQADCEAVDFEYYDFDQAESITEPSFAECHLEEQGMGDGDTKNYATPAKAVAWRDGQGQDRPIAVFDVHLEASDGPKDFAPRVGEVRSLMEKMDALLAADPGGFNAAGADDSTRTSPRHPQNRMIILGDWNVRCHECGENYWMVRMLREHYGYALDVAMAIYDDQGRLSFGTHTLDDGYDASGIPIPYQHHTKDGPRGSWTGWRNEDPPDQTPHSVYPWWSVDWRDKTSLSTKKGERLSMIVLVGRGWAMDDPVVDYAVMSDSHHVSPLNPDGRAVEMWRDCDNKGSAFLSGLSFRPRYSLGCDSDSLVPGAAAIHGDHKPMGVRLRVLGP